MILKKTLVKADFYQNKLSSALKPKSPYIKGLKIN
jgi:hypothetical protein